MSIVRAEAAAIRELLGPVALQPGWRFRTPLDLVDALGVSFRVSPAPEALRGPAKQCYANAGRLALLEGSPDRYVYVEGFAVYSEEIPLSLPHAWVYDTFDEKALEVTWPEPGIEYLGVPFVSSWLRNFLLLRSCWGVLDSPAMLREDADPARYRLDDVPRS